MAFQRAVGWCKAVMRMTVNSFCELLAEGSMLRRFYRVRPLHRQGVLAPNEALLVKAEQSRVVSRLYCNCPCFLLGNRDFYLVFAVSAV